MVSCPVRTIVGLLLVCGLVGAGASACVPRSRKSPKNEKKSEVVSTAHQTVEPRTSLKANEDRSLSGTFTDQFQRTQLGSNWRALTSAWKIEDGQLCGEGAKNHPIWLKRRLPLNARVEFEATSRSPNGDIKAEFWGDGRSAAAGVSYKDATSYLTIFGGWKNTLHVLARLDEHGSDRLEIKLRAGSAEFTSRTVVADQKYNFRVERRNGKTVDWFVNDRKLLGFSDSTPLQGAGHEHFGFNNWQTKVCFDHLKITALPNAKGKPHSQ